MLGTLFSVYLIVDAGLDPFRLLILGTVLEASVLVFEVPTGVVADVVSRRLSVIVGLFVIGAGLFLTGAFESFGLLVLGSTLWGLGWTFVRGAEEAWIADEVGEDEAAKLYLGGRRPGSSVRCSASRWPSRSPRPTSACRSSSPVSDGWCSGSRWRSSCPRSPSTER